ncbi:MAG: recombination mediator RecR [Candidatus Margulisiibacteriota bacterium]|jgi:recombination protein RecR
MLQNPLQELIQQLTILPGIGPKSAEKLAFFFLSLPKNEVQKFCAVLGKTRENIKYCERCFNICFSNICTICQDEFRNKNLLCIVAESKDIYALERTNYPGLYHVLGGLISPIDGIHPEILRLNELETRLKTEPINEIILAINSSIEGETTILYLAKILEAYQIPLTRLAHGLPMGADIEYIDEITLGKAFQGRVKL